VPEDINISMWEKFLFIAPISGVGAVTRAPVGISRSIPETRQLLEQAMQEVVAVARARKVMLSDDAVARKMAFVDSLSPTVTASMQRDIMDGRKSELGSQNGAVVRMGLEAGVPTPVNTYLYYSLLPQELRARGEQEF
jgi:2-dehydropantoate 2-reductase